jgi:hypothetical protein
VGGNSGRTPMRLEFGIPWICWGTSDLFKPTLTLLQPSRAPLGRGRRIRKSLAGPRGVRYLDPACSMHGAHGKAEARCAKSRLGPLRE